MIRKSMIGPHDLPPLEPSEILGGGSNRRAKWQCPRCEEINESLVNSAGLYPVLCRGCLGAISLIVPPEINPIHVPTLWLTVLPCGARIQIQECECGGYRFDIEKEGRAYGGYDSIWNRNDAYNAAQRAVQSRKKRF